MGLMPPSLRRVAHRADARVFCVCEPAAEDRVRELRLADGIRLTSTPRDASVLLIAGDLDPRLVAPTMVAHDAVARPRATVWWRLGSTSEVVPANFRPAMVVDGDDPVPALRETHERLIEGDLDTESPLLPDVEPAPWRGVGPYGQGGKGMTGGAPYGRPLAERADGRDGLKLDQLPVPIGPFFPAFPPGLVLDVKLQGDVIQDVVVASLVDPPVRATSVFHRARHEPVALGALELARARSHLRWLSDAVAVAGGVALSERILNLTRSVRPGDGDAVRALERSLRRRGYLRWNTRGVGPISPDDLEGVGGPVARASGSSSDARSEDDAYGRLGFEPITQDAGDSAARWTQRVREAAQALDLAAGAGYARFGPAGAVESPRGRLGAGELGSAALARLIPALVVGLEWGDAVTTIVSLDLDPTQMNGRSR